MNKKTKARFLKILKKHTTVKGKRYIYFQTDENVLKAVEEFLYSEKESLIKNPKYTTRKGYEVVAFLMSECNFLNVSLIGSLGRGENSNNDIDILLRNETIESSKEKLIEILKPKQVVETDWGGLYFYDTIFGDIDIFFSDKDFTY